MKKGCREIREKERKVTQRKGMEVRWNKMKKGRPEKNKVNKRRTKSFKDNYIH